MSKAAMCAKYSILLATNKVDVDKLQKALNDGLKVIVFCQAEDESMLRLRFKEFIDVDFLNVFRNPFGEDVVIIDGEHEDEKMLERLEEGDGRFNLEQYLIEHESVSHHMIIEAGAGTGKTHVMINRIMYLMHMDSNFSFANVAMITFTNKATDNMRHRLINTINAKYKLTGNVRYLNCIEDLARISISTIHSFFKKVIVEVGPMLGYGTNIQLQSYLQEKRELLREILNEQYGGNQRVEDELGLSLIQIEKLALEYWEKLDNNGLSEEEIHSLNWGDTSSEKEKTIQKSLINVFSIADQRYNEIKYINNSISMKDIIHELSRVVNREDIKGYLTSKYRYMFCDEFQDSDNVQIQTIATLNRIYMGRLFVVGDIKQSIYRFRGATDSAFEKLERTMSTEEKQGLVRFSLKKNYRTAQGVLDELDAIFSLWGPNGMRCLQYECKDRLVSQNDDCGVYVQKVVSKDTRRREVVDTIRQLFQNQNVGTVTCLTRTNAELKRIREWCEDEKIVCLIKERGGFYQSDAVLDFCALVEAFLFENEPMFLFNYVMSAYASGEIDYEALTEADGEKTKVFGVLLKGMDSTAWRRFRVDLRYKPVMSVLREMVEFYNPVETYARRRKGLLLYKRYPEEKACEQATIDTLQYEANLKKLLHLLTNQFSGDFSTLADICDCLRLKILTDHTEELAEIGNSDNVKFVQGVTVHGAKGLEFENVLLPFMNNQFSRHFQSEILLSKDKSMVGWAYRKNGECYQNKQYNELLTDEDIEVAKEEARLLYVAMTRTIKRLYCFVERNGRGQGCIETWADLLPEEKDNA